MIEEFQLATQELSKLKIDRQVTANSPRKKRKWLIIVAIGITAAIILVLLAKKGGRVEVETNTVTYAFPSQEFSLLNATGYVVAQRKAALSSKGTGRLEWLGVLEGSQVHAGEIIARLENKDVMASLEQANANVKVAEANLLQGQAELRDAERSYHRSEELLAQKYIAPSAIDSALARFNKAKAAISGFQASIAAAKANRQSAQVAVDQTVIRAPFDGVILTKNANVGDNITPFSAAADSKGAVVTIADMETLEVEADVAESSLSKIKVNQACEIQLDAFPDVRLAGVVSRMVPTLDRSKATLLVKVRFVEHDARVLPDMSAKVSFMSKAVPAAENKPVLAADAHVLTKRNGKDVVFVEKDGKLSMREVHPGIKIGDLVALPETKSGEHLVMNPAPELLDGAEIKLAKK